MKINHVMVILCINLTGLRDAQMAGKTLFLGVSVKMLLDEISTGMGTVLRKMALISVGRPHPI